MEDHGCNTPTSVWFCHPQICHLFNEVSSCTCSSECLCCPHLYSSGSNVSHLLGHNFWCSPRRAMIQLPIIWEEWWPGDTDIVNLQTQLMSSVTEVSSQTWNFWGPVAPQLKSKQSSLRKNSKQEKKQFYLWSWKAAFIGSSLTLRIEREICMLLQLVNSARETRNSYGMSLDSDPCLFIFFFIFKHDPLLGHAIKSQHCPLSSPSIGPWCLIPVERTIHNPWDVRTLFVPWD